MQHHDNGPTQFALGAQQFHHAQLVKGVKRGHRLVGQQQRGLDGECTCQPCAGALAAEALIEAAVLQCLEAHVAYCARHRVIIRGGAAPARTVRKAAEGNEIVHRQWPHGMVALGQIGQPGGALTRRQATQCHTVEMDRALIGQQLCNRAQQAALARAIGADEAEEFARTRTVVLSDCGRHLVRQGAAAMAYLHALENQSCHAIPMRWRSTSAKKNGAPISAVTTPSMSSKPPLTMRSTMSAASTSTAPPSALDTSRRAG